jgi:hypothetical protein
MTNIKLVDVLSTPKYNSRKFMVVMSIVLVSVIADMILMFIVTGRTISSNWGIVAYIIIAVIYGTGQYLILGFVKQRSKKITSPQIKRTDITVTIMQYVLVGFIIWMILQLISSSHYNTSTLISAVTINYAIASAVMCTLSIKFILWYKSIRSYVVLLYGLASAAVTASMIILLIFNAASLIILPPVRDSQSDSSLQFFDQETPMGILQYVSAVSNFVPLFLLWVSSTILLQHYSRKLGQVKFWIIMSIPIIFFVIQPVLIAPLTLGIKNPGEDTLYIDILGNLLPGTLGGILFGVPFLAIARNLPSSSILKDSMIIAAWGFILFNITTSASVSNAPYLPYGFATVLLTELSCYLILIGFYSSAISISKDSRLRQFIRKSIMDDSKFFDAIGTANMEQEIQKRVMKVVKEQQNDIVEEDGVQPSITEDEIKDYMSQVLQEIHHKRKS